RTMDPGTKGTIEVTPGTTENVLEHRTLSVTHLLIAEGSVTRLNLHESSLVAISTGKHLINGRSQLVDDFIEVLLFEDERRRQQDVVALAAIHRTPGGIAHQTSLHGRSLDASIDTAPCIEGRLG